MSISSGQQPRKAPVRDAIRKWETQVVARKPDDEGEGENSKLGRITDSVIRHIVKNFSGDEARSKFLQSVAEITEKITKDTEEHAAVTQKQPDQTEKNPNLIQRAKDSEEHTVNQKQPDQTEKKPSVTFGPFYRVDSGPIQQAKAAALDHIVKESGTGAKSAYERSLKVIEKGAMEKYVIPDKDKLKPKEFRDMMLTDGCFFLQLALHVLGGRDLLHHREDHPYFGKEAEPAELIPDMFFMGNQIPYEVIRVLMEQPFFRGVINKGIQNRTWNCSDEENIAKMALYLTVVKPAFWNRVQKNSYPTPPEFSEPPRNILDCLHNLFLGIRAHELKGSESKDAEWLEASSNDNKIEFPSAGDLSKKGIKLETHTRLRLRQLGKKVPTKGIKNIYFRNLGYRAKIYLPTLTIQSHTRDILINLMRYEQNMNEGEREVTAYVRFMRDLVRTHDDFKILEEKKIIKVKDENLKGTIIHMFEELAALHNSNFTLTFRHIRQKITDYGGPPLYFFGYVISFFGVVATIFTILAYVHPLT